jgi:protein-tyrosine phosphatase
MRAVHLPSGIAGELWLGPMPGRLRPWSEDLDRLRKRQISLVVSLTPAAEVEAKAPDYADALASGIGIDVARFAIADFGVPDDEDGLLTVVERAAGSLTAGARVFVHCAAGIGRTGTVATCILLALGMRQADAARLVAAAGSGPETEGQRDLVGRVAESMAERASARPANAEARD